MNPFDEFMYGLSAFSNMAKICVIVVVVLSVVNFLLLLLVLANQADTKSLIRQLANKDDENGESEKKNEPELHTIG